MKSADLLRVFGKKYSVEILAAAGEPRTAQELSDAVEIPPATCYRRLEELHDHGLLEARQTNRADDNRSITVYQRNTDIVRITFEQSLSVTLEEHQTAKGKIEELYQKLSGRFPPDLD